MKLKVLGCGDAFASEGRFNTSFLLYGKDKKVLVDCGASTLIRMKQEGVSPADIDDIVITHFHGDHYGGLPFQVISNKNQYGRTKPLTIWGPAGIKERVIALQDALYPGTVPMLEQINVVFKEFLADAWVETGGVAVYAKTVTHAPPSSPHGVKVKLDDKVFAFSGDTCWDDNLPDLADGSDLFVCECNHLHGDSPAHLGYETIFKNKNKFNTKRLMLTHMGSEVIHATGLEIERLEDLMEVEF